MSPALNAKSLCTLTSEEEPDVTITMKYVLAYHLEIHIIKLKD